MQMSPDPRVTPTGDAAPTPAASRQDNPAFGSLTVDRLGMEVANELGIDPNGLSAFGLTEQKVRDYEARTHSGTQNGGNSR